MTGEEKQGEQAENEEGSLRYVIQKIAHDLEAEHVEALLAGPAGEVDLVQTLALLVGLAEKGLAAAVEEDEGQSDAAAEGGAAGDDDELYFSTIEQAKCAVDAHCSGKPKDGRYLRRMADWILEHRDQVEGDSILWYNFINIFSKSNDWRYTLKLAIRALEFYPYDMDLLGHAIRAAGMCGDWETGLHCIRQAKKLDWKYWGWYPAVHTGEFYKKYALVCPPEQRSAALAEGIEVLQRCREFFPLEERLYNQEAELLIADNRVDEARAVLESAIWEQHPGNDGQPCRIAAAQCCMTYLQSILENTSDYEKIQKVSQRGIQSCAVTSEPVKAGTFLFYQALAMDGAIHEEAQGNSAKGFGNEALVRQALAEYKLAYRLSDVKLYRNIIRKRFAILSAKSGIDDIKLLDESTD